MISPTVQLQTVWRDRDKREAQLTLYFPFSLNLSSLLSSANNYISKIAAISNARLVAYKLVWRGTIDEPGEPDPASDVTRFLALFYRNEDELPCEAIFIPSPKPDVFEMEGTYQGIRADISSALLTPFIDGTLVANLRTPEGLDIPATLWVGGLRL